MSAILYRLGFALRETGQAVERLGATLQGINSFKEHSAWGSGPATRHFGAGDREFEL